MFCWYWNLFYQLRAIFENKKDSNLYKEIHLNDPLQLQLYLQEYSRMTSPKNQKLSKPSRLCGDICKEIYSKQSIHLFRKIEMARFHIFKPVLHICFLHCHAFHNLSVHHMHIMWCSVSFCCIQSVIL